MIGQDLPTTEKEKWERFDAQLKKIVILGSGGIVILLGLMVSPHFLYAAVAVGVGAAWLAFPKTFTAWVQANQLMFLGASLGFFFSYPGLHSLIGLCLGGWLGHFIHETLRNAFYVATHPRQVTGQVVSHLWEEAKNYVSGPAPTESIHNGSANEVNPETNPLSPIENQAAPSYFPAFRRFINETFANLAQPENKDGNEENQNPIPFIGFDPFA